MDPPILLFLLRLLSAALLLAFFGAIAWLMLQDLQVTREALLDEGRDHGNLRVIANQDSAPPLETTFPLLPVTSIGRAQGNNVVLANGFTSGEHALITRRGQQWWLEDLGSRNGTFLNEHPLEEPTVISSGDIIAIGGVQLKVEI